ncbi:unnamed protein product (macronuclear) [Paramecium tetraurelia]|uniref:Uncharacterized protein n=1 Tax=Paramecium tetraurelia TaxID=5888 RepID=A0BEP5_PARTE|nr:uncharacterized protein GSPATT00028045001 [Paramecium tetraurelia]CAK57012.1 unnamed protein product [Paramecium tetraurelia]|eukprot:XP_001424410.1 hypothetical protein (macronuclear) [Paramecium tetraurelia strain d4-2]
MDMHNSQNIENLSRKQNSQKKQEKFASRITFLRLVLCDKRTIRASAQICKINFSTAKAILNKFRRHGVLQESNKDYDGQLDLLRQIVQIQKGIRCEQISKMQLARQKLNNQLQLFLQNNQKQKYSEQFNSQMDKDELEQQLRQEQQNQYNLLRQILEQQIILINKICR